MRFYKIKKQDSADLLALGVHSINNQGCNTMYIEARQRRIIIEGRGMKKRFAFLSSCFHKPGLHLIQSPKRRRRANMRLSGGISSRSVMAKSKGTMMCLRVK